MSRAASCVVTRGTGRGQQLRRRRIYLGSGDIAIGDLNGNPVTYNTSGCTLWFTPFYSCGTTGQPGAPTGSVRPQRRERRLAGGAAQRRRELRARLHPAHDADDGRRRLGRRHPDHGQCRGHHRRRHRRRLHQRWRRRRLMDGGTGSDDINGATGTLDRVTYASRDAPRVRHVRRRGQRRAAGERRQRPEHGRRDRRVGHGHAVAPRRRIGNRTSTSTAARGNDTLTGGNGNDILPRRHRQRRHRRQRRRQRTR